MFYKLAPFIFINSGNKVLKKKKSISTGSCPFSRYDGKEEAASTYLQKHLRASLQGHSGSRLPVKLSERKDFWLEILQDCFDTRRRNLFSDISHLIKSDH